MSLLSAISRLAFPHKRGRILLLAVLVVSWPGLAQQKPSQDVPAASGTKAGADSSAAPQTALPQKPAAPQHRFWDKQNKWLFAGVAAARTLDGTSTRNFRARGRNEGLLNNDIVDNAPAFAAIEFAGTAASIGTSYWLHRARHHKLERWVSYLHIGIGFFGDARNYALPSIHRPRVVP